MQQKRILQVHKLQKENKGKCGHPARWDRVTKDILKKKKAEILNIFVTSVFTCKTGLQEPKAIETREKSTSQWRRIRVGNA